MSMIRWAKCIGPAIFPVTACVCFVAHALYGSIVTWGMNEYGPTDVPALNSDFAAIAAPDELAGDSGHTALPVAPFGEMLPRHADSGVRTNPDQFAATVATEIIATPDALWTRLYFSEITLERDSRIRFTSLFDGEVQELDAEGVAMWGYTSAYFNGGIVMIELIAGPGTTRNRFVLEEIGVEFGVIAVSNHCTPPLCGRCGDDTRVPSNENWACALLRSGSRCSAAIYNESSHVISAGHCMGSNMVIQFNVPLSNPDCSLNHPPVDDQFPIVYHLSQDGGPGADWAAMISGVNSLGQTAFERFGEYRPIAASIPNSGPADAWSYGIENPDECILSGTQRHSTGQVVSINSSSVRHTADITCGNSGSPLLQDGQIIGVVTHGHCLCPTIPHRAQRIDWPAFVAARAFLLEFGDIEPEHVTVPGDYPTIQAAINAVPFGSTITVSPGTYNEAIVGGKNLTIISSDGPEVTIIDAAGQNASVVRLNSYDSPAARIEGFTLTGGTGSSLSDPQYNFGGGILSDGSSAMIVNCIIVNNTAEFCGGALNFGGSPTYENCVFESNTSTSNSFPVVGGGGVCNASSAPTFIDTLFIGNTTVARNGGAMFNQYTGPVLAINCQFIDNSAAVDGGAVSNFTNTVSEFINCSFQSNTAGGSGGAFSNADTAATLIADSTFCGNAPNDIDGDYTDGDGNEFFDECPDNCAGPADLNCDGVVNVDDLFILLAAWGECADPDDCPADLDGNGVVDVDDLFILLANWG